MLMEIDSIEKLPKSKEEIREILATFNYGVSVDIVAEILAAETISDGNAYICKAIGEDYFDHYQVKGVRKGADAHFSQFKTTIEDRKETPLRREMILLGLICWKRFDDYLVADGRVGEKNYIRPKLMAALRKYTAVKNFPG